MSSIPRRFSALPILALLAVLCAFSHAQAQGAPEVSSDESNVEGSADSPATVLQDSAPVTPVAPVPAASGTTWSGAPGRGLTVDAGDAFGFNIRARAMVRADFRSPGPATDTQREWTQSVSVGTLRLWLGGHVYSRNLTWLMQFAFAQADYRDDATSPVYDAYLNWQPSRDLGIRVGQYFVPFDRLRTIREWGLQMTARPRPVNELTLDRDVGVMFYSDSFLGDESPVAWRLGVFGGRGIHDTSPVEPGALLVARVELRPLGEIDDDMEGDLGRRVQPALALGAGYAMNLNTDRVRSTTGGTFANGTTDFQHVAADLVFKWRGLAVAAEYLLKTADEDTLVADREGVEEPSVEYTRSAHGWVTQISYVFPKPFELVARMSRITAHSGTDPVLVQELEAYGQESGVGANWYFNGHRMKLQASWLARTPTTFDFSAAEHVVQTQLDVTF